MSAFNFISVKAFISVSRYGGEIDLKFLARSQSKIVVLPSSRTFSKTCSCSPFVESVDARFFVIFPSKSLFWLMTGPENVVCSSSLEMDNTGF